MTKHITQKESIEKRIFNNETIRRACRMYRNYINVRLEELQAAKEDGKGRVVMLLQSELYHLQKNLAEVEIFEEEEEDELYSAGEMETLTAPVHIKDIKARIINRKNAEKAIAVYTGYVDVYLDVLSSAMKTGDTNKADEAKAQLTSLQENIAALKSECF